MKLKSKHTETKKLDGKEKEYELTVEVYQMSKKEIKERELEEKEELTEVKESVIIIGKKERDKIIAQLQDKKERLLQNAKLMSFFISNFFDTP